MNLKAEKQQKKTLELKAENLKLKNDVKTRLYKLEMKKIELNLRLFKFNNNNNNNQ